MRTNQRNEQKQYTHTLIFNNLRYAIASVVAIEVFDCESNRKIRSNEISIRLSFVLSRLLSSAKIESKLKMLICFFFFSLKRTQVRRAWCGRSHCIYI